MKKREEMYSIDMHEGACCRVMTVRRADSMSKIIRIALKIADNFDNVFKLSSIKLKKTAS